MNSINNNNIKVQTAEKTGILGSRIVLPENYLPKEDEKFMNESQLEFLDRNFKWKNELLDEANLLKMIFLKKVFKDLILQTEHKLKVTLPLSGTR